MRDFVSLSRALAASCCAGVFYGAVTGMVLGTLWFPGIGTVFGFFAGSLGGLVFGAIGGIFGGIGGWALAGFAGGLLVSSCLGDGRPIHFWAYPPALAMSVMGLAIAAGGNSRLPLCRWVSQARANSTLMQNFNLVRLVLGLLALIGTASLLKERLTAPVKPDAFAELAAE